MIFETLDDALADISKLGTWDSDRLIAHYDISCQYTDDLPENVNGYSIPLTRTMFVNERAASPYHVQDHELMHCLTDSSSEPLIETAMVSNTKIEFRANFGAFCIMVMDYITKSGIEPEDFDILRFGKAYNIDTKYLLNARNAAEKMLKIKINSGAFGL
ncbi:hypothetical protein C5Z25_01710 [Lactobacillus sp. CBA3605]|uniref:hypothetical protein n=1 Tax=Lactobacillus sp. CBA3605 TaxID=2099788 RepID=UPI000CFD9E79|nr:hypothetical protein [Lactobacillus sp. CBA3605]AVK60563.1 hypothetical protein C5Z25_01710 [Lactobacillus sp. CBA3605]